MSTIAIVPQPQGAGGYVELASPSPTRGKVQGKVFKKQILRFGTLKHPKAPGGKVDINDEFADALIKNFKDGACDIVQMTMVDEKNRHTEDPARNLGEVIDLTKEADGVYAVVDARKNADDFGKTLLGASAAMYLDYTDTDNGTSVGPTLTHMAVTNRPYVLGLKGYEEALSLSAADTNEQVILLSGDDDDSERERITKMEKDEFIALAKSEFGIDIPALEDKAKKHDDAIALSSRVQTELAETGFLTLSNDAEASADDIVHAVSETAKQVVNLSAEVKDLREASDKAAAEKKVDSLVRQGRILPAKRDAHVDLLLSMGEEKFDGIIPDKALVPLSQGDDELGADISLSSPAGGDATVKSEVDRIVNGSGAASGLFGKTKAA